MTWEKTTGDVSAKRNVIVKMSTFTVHAFYSLCIKIDLCVPHAGSGAEALILRQEGASAF